MEGTTVKSTESITEIIKAIEEAKGKTNFDKFFDWLFRLAIAALIWFSSKTIDKVDAFSDKFNSMEIQMNNVDNKTQIIQHDIETVKRDVSKMEISIDKLSEKK